jgi:serine/threonine protein kinase
LTDFGVVRADRLAEHTTTGAFVGTIRYAAPEYLFGEDYDKSIDVYSFGAIAYELVTNRQAFERHQYWSRVVAAKADRTSHGLAYVHMRDVGGRLGSKAADFLYYVIDHSFSVAGKRHVNLRMVAKALEDALWRHGLVVKNGLLTLRLEASPPDKYGDDNHRAAAAFKTIRAPERQLCYDFITHYYWDPYVDLSEPDAQPFLTACSPVIGYNSTEYGWSMFIFYESMKSALAFRMLE